MKKILFLFACLISVFPVQGQRIAPIDSWTAYVAHQNVIEITQKGNTLYCITDGGMFTRDITTGEIRTFSTIEGLSAIDPSTIYLDSQSGNIFIGYQDGMVNYFSDPDDIQYVSDIARTELFTTKAIHRFSSHNGLLYIATDFGIVVFDVTAGETRFSVTKIGTNLTGSPVYDITVANDSIFAALGTAGLFAAPLSAPNLTLPSVWTSVSGVNGLPIGRSNFVTATSTKIYAEVVDTIFVRNYNGTWSKAQGLPKADWRYLNVENDYLLAAIRDWIYTIDPAGNLFTMNTYGNNNCVYTLDGQTRWVGDQVLGLMRSFNFGYDPFGPDGPVNNYVTQVSAGGGEFYVAPRGKKGTSDRYYDGSGIYYFNYADGGWKNSSLANQRLSQAGVYLDFARAYRHPATGRTFLASWGQGVVEMQDGEVLQYYTPKNSGMSPSLAIIGDSSARCSAVLMDDQQNLWVAQMLGDYSLNLLTNTGDWYNYFPESIYPIGMVMDDFGNLWINNQGQGLVVFNNNNTPSVTNDDKKKYLTNITGQGNLPNNSVYGLAKDLNGHIWVGTSEGVVVFYDPGSVFNNNYPDASCPIIEGFCLLRDQKVVGIAVDGANRKWIATENGIYLISADGTEQLAHFTEANSPLFDDEIKDITIDQSTGEVFIGTNKGLMSYMGEATGGLENSLDLIVSPNPVPSTYDGVIAITGSVAESSVRITTASGLLVKELESFGGQTIWDGTDAYGNRVRPGIYLVMLATQDATSPGIAKIAILD